MLNAVYPAVDPVMIEFCFFVLLCQVTAILQEAGFTHVAVEVEVVAASDVVRERPPSQWGLGTLVRSHNNQYPSSIRAI